MVTAHARVKHGADVAELAVELSPEAVEIRGPLRLRIPLDRIADLHVDGALLILESPRGRTEIELPDPATAAAWFERIRNPRTLLDKLGVRTGSRVALLGPADPALLAKLAERTDRVASEAQQGTQIVLLWAANPLELEPLARLRTVIAADGAIWVVFPKGGRAIREVDVIETGKRAGLVDNKVVAFSPTETALRLVIPLAARGATAPPRGRG